MLIVECWRRLSPVLCLFGALSACTTTPPLKDTPVTDKPVVIVPELDSKASIPLSIGVYLPPRVLGRTAIMDLRHGGTSIKSVISNGPTGSATIAAVAHYFPALFAKVYLVSNFPDARLIKHKLDVVIVIQDTATRHLPGTAATATDIWETQLKLAIYRPDGTQLDHYSVSTTSKPTDARPTDPAALINWTYQASEESIKPALRMALQRFPKTEVLNRLLAESKHNSHAHDEPYWLNVSKEFTQTLDKEKIFIPLPDMTLHQYLDRPDVSAVENMVVSNSLVLHNTDLIAQYYNANPSEFTQHLLNLSNENKSISQVYVQQIQAIAEKKHPAHTPLAFKRITGFNKPKPKARLVTTQTPEPVSELKQPTPATAAVTPLFRKDDNPQLQKSIAIIESLKHIDNKTADTKSNNDEACMQELRRSKQDLLANAKTANANVQLLRSASSGAIVYTPGHCARPVPKHSGAVQSMHEAQRVALCGVQTVNCALAKIYTGMACQAAIQQCMQQAPIAR